MSRFLFEYTIRYVKPSYIVDLISLDCYATVVSTRPIERAVRSAGLAERLDRARRSNVAPTTYKSERPEAERLTLDSGVEPSFRFLERLFFLLGVGHMVNQA